MPQLRSPRIWGTFSAAGGVGTTTFTLHLAQLGARSGARVLLVESDIRAPLREILGGEPPFWEEYRVGTQITHEALPRPMGIGFALLTRRSLTEVTPELFAHVIESARQNFDLILCDNPAFTYPNMSALVVVENALPSLIGLNSTTSLHNPKIAVINKVKSRGRKNIAIEGFIRDMQIFKVAKSTELKLGLGLGVARKLGKKNSQVFGEILKEMLT